MIHRGNVVVDVFDEPVAAACAPDDSIVMFGGTPMTLRVLYRPGRGAAPDGNPSSPSSEALTERIIKEI
jgi:hypothetical protein